MLRRRAAQRPLDDDPTDPAESVAEVLHWRITRRMPAPLSDPDRPDWLPGWVPTPPHPDEDVATPGDLADIVELGTWLRARVEQIADRTRELGERVAQEPPAWAANLGPVPDDPVKRDLWIRRAGHVAAYRERWEIPDSLTADDHYFSTWLAARSMRIILWPILFMIATIFEIYLYETMLDIPFFWTGNVGHSNNNSISTTRNVFQGVAQTRHHIPCGRNRKRLEPQRHGNLVFPQQAVHLVRDSAPEFVRDVHVALGHVGLRPAHDVHRGAVGDTQYEKERGGGVPGVV